MNKFAARFDVRLRKELTSNQFRHAAGRIKQSYGTKAATLWEMEAELKNDGRSALGVDELEKLREEVSLLQEREHEMTRKAVEARKMEERKAMQRGVGTQALGWPDE